MPYKKKQEIKSNIENGIKRLGNFQHPNGGMSYWMGENTANDWSTMYAGHFMIEAEKKGYVLPSGFKQKWLSYQKNQSKQWRFNGSYQNDFAQAYRLYTLALAGSADLGSMNRLRETVGISDETKLRLAATYAVIGQKNAALKIINSVSSFDYNYRKYYYYGSEDSSREMLLETSEETSEETSQGTLTVPLCLKLSSSIVLFFSKTILTLTDASLNSS